MAGFRDFLRMVMGWWSSVDAETPVTVTPTLTVYGRETAALTVYGSEAATLTVRGREASTITVFGRD